VGQGGGEPRGFQRGHRTNTPVRRVGHDAVQGAIVIGHVGIEETQGAQDDAEFERDVLSAGHFRRFVVFHFRPLEAAADRADDVARLEFASDMKLGREPDFDVTDPLGQVVGRQFVRNAFQAFFILHHRAGIGESGEVIGQAPVGILEHGFPQAFLRHGRELDLLLPGKIDEGGQAEGAVQVKMNIGFGDDLDKFRGDWGSHQAFPIRARMKILFEVMDVLQTKVVQIPLEQVDPGVELLGFLGSDGPPAVSAQEARRPLGMVPGEGVSLVHGKGEEVFLSSSNRAIIFHITVMPL
jgi:hypothetical protein